VTIHFVAAVTLSWQSYDFVMMSTSSDKTCMIYSSEQGVSMGVFFSLIKKITT